MSTLNRIKTTLVQHAACEVDKLSIGDMACADDMLWERIETDNRIFAIECLIAKDDAQYQSLIEFLYEQLKELNVKLTIKI